MRSACMIFFFLVSWGYLYAHTVLGNEEASIVPHICRQFACPGSHLITSCILHRYQLAWLDRVSPARRQFCFGLLF